MRQTVNIAVQEAAEAATMNQSTLQGCKIEVAVAAHMGGVGTHPIILHQVLLSNFCVITWWQSCQSFANVLSAASTHFL
jgi:hypothetical protein